MLVPGDDMLCRFISRENTKWSEANQRPRPAAFKEHNGISVWNVNELATREVEPGELAIGVLSGSGQAHHTAADYIEIALEATKRVAPLTILVEWRPEVEEAWRKWSYAHVQVEFQTFNDAAGVYFRQQLSQRVRHIVPPSKS